MNNKNISSHFYAGVQALQSENLPQAEAHFQAILELHPNHVPTLINLGALELKRGEGQTAIAYFTQVLILDESNVMARQNLAATFMHYDRFENAMTHYNELKKRNLLEIDDLYNMGVASAALGQLSEAIDCYQQVLAEEDTHNAALNNLAAIYIRLGKKSEAIEFLQRALQVKPGDTSSRFMLDVLMNNTYNPETSQDYVRNLFNNYALYYEQHLKKMLEYSLPEQCLERLKALGFNQFLNVLDLGCGTGLSGLVWREYCDHLTGVDLSQKMLEQARKKNVYHELMEADILAFLRESQQHYDLIQALDVLPYFGELKTLLSLVLLRLEKSGLLLLSAEISDDVPWKIQDSMRFCHHPDYIHDLLLSGNMCLLHRSRVVARKENEQNLYVMLFVYQKIG